MSKRQPRVPGMRETRPNREQRRHPGRAGDEAPTREAPEPGVQGPREVGSPRAKSSGHGKKTADNWNQ